MAKEKLKYTASINAKGLDQSGVTEDLARQMAATQGSHTMLIVEVKHGPKTIDEDGNTKVNLIMGSVEPVPTELEEKVREFQRSLYRQRPEQIGQEVLKGTAEGPQPADALTDLENAADEWDGNPDAPVTNQDGAAEVKVEKPGKGKRGLAAVPEGVDTGEVVDECPSPGCDLPAEHDGDHGTNAASGE